MYRLTIVFVDVFRFTDIWGLFVLSYTFSVLVSSIGKCILSLRALDLTYLMLLSFVSVCLGKLGLDMAGPLADSSCVCLSVSRLSI